MTRAGLVGILVSPQAKKSPHHHLIVTSSSPHRHLIIAASSPHHRLIVSSSHRHLIGILILTVIPADAGIQFFYAYYPTYKILH